MRIEIVEGEITAPTEGRANSEFSACSVRSGLSSGQHPPGDDAISDPPPAESLGVRHAASQAAELAHDPRRAHNRVLIGRWQHKTRIVGWPWHMLAAVLQQHLLLDGPHIADVYVIFWQKV